jgi:glycosyltransferase involved in cell wall biosynthesis
MEPLVKQKLLILTRLFGASGQPWLWRQVVGIGAFHKTLVCWERMNRETQPDRNVAVAVLDEEAAPYDTSSRWLYRLRNVPGLNFYGSLGRERRRLTELLRLERPALVLCYFGDIAMRLLPVLHKEGVPLVAYLHGDFLFVTNRWYRWSLKRCLKHFAAIVVVTEAERRWLLAQGLPGDRIHVIPCGAPTDIFRPGVRNEGGPVRFVMASRLIAEKGCDLSLEAFGLVAPDIGDAELHIFGDGPDRAALHRLVEARGLATRVFFHGYVEEQRFARELPSYDVFIQHSIGKEGSPVSIAEAMACGLPVVATPVGGIVEQVVEGKTGLLVAERDVRGMEAAMRRLADDFQLRQHLGEAGRERVVQLYDTATLTRRLERLLLDLARASSYTRNVRTGPTRTACGRPAASTRSLARADLRGYHR